MFGKKSSSVSQTAPHAKANSKLDMLFEKSVMPTCLVILFTIMPYGAIMAYIASYGINQGIENIGIYFSMYALSLFVVRLGVGRLSDRYGITAIIILGIVLMFCGLIVLGWASNLTIFLISAILFGLGFGVVFPLLQATGYVFSSDWILNR
ncbi:MFS transporter [Oenococcus oeni]|uniref:MFS transporter n=2 Tax=Oenococcus oeni TaxID=1247 RepID=UPI0021508B6B|nr:MFS transporter [Oenococcus oeni]